MNTVAGVALAFSMFLTVADVIMRSFKRPITGTFDLVGLLGAVVIGFAIPQTSRLRGHVLMDFLTSALPAGAQRFLHVVTRLLAIVLFAIMAWTLWGLGNDFRQTGEVSPTIQLPFYFVAYGIAICCVVECLVLVVDMVERREPG
ncbi:MAG: TRAP transporter small permease, partial [Deltaproteobacteria bacterium]|nr:TRAP transporter small permease [Deltaproteobacteria bacterium]